MSKLKVSVISYSLSFDPSTLKEWEEKLFGEIKQLSDENADVILYPELFLMGVGKYFAENSPLEQIKKIATYLEVTLLPKVASFVSSETLLVLGSSPRQHAGKIFNSAPILHKGKWYYQDKLYLTPWETDFTPGEELHVFSFRGLKTAVVICFDSEQPDLSLKLKEEGIDLILVPSATTNLNGSQRVNRCASARAIELGAAVITSPLVGDSVVDLVDHNEGRQALFLPAQEDITVPQEEFSEYSSSKHIVAQYYLDLIMLKKLKMKSSETKPFHERIKSHLTISKR